MLAALDWQRIIVGRVIISLLIYIISPPLSRGLSLTLYLLLLPIVRRQSIRQVQIGRHRYICYLAYYRQRCTSTIYSQLIFHHRQRLLFVRVAGNYFLKLKLAVWPSWSLLRLMLLWLLLTSRFYRCLFIILMSVKFWYWQQQQRKLCCCLSLFYGFVFQRVSSVTI